MTVWRYKWEAEGLDGACISLTSREDYIMYILGLPGGPVPHISYRKTGLKE